METEQVTEALGETLTVFDTAEPRTTPEVAARLGLGRRTTYARLQRLAEANQIKTKKVGANARVWWRPPGHGIADAPDQLAALTEVAVDYAVCSLDSTGCVRSWNVGAERLTGYEQPEIVGEHVATLYPEGDVAAGDPEDDLSTARQRGRLEDEGWRVRADGSRFLARVTITPIPGGGYGMVLEDVTRTRQEERRHEERTVRLQRQRDTVANELDVIFSRVTDAVYGLDDEWRFTHVNERAEELLGRPREDLLGAVIWDVFPEALDSDLEDHYRTAMETQEPVTFDRTLEPLGIRARVRAYPSDTGLSVYFRDVTEEKERQERLELFETIVSTMDDGIYVLDEDACFAEVNEAYAEMTGYDREELLGAHCSLVVDEAVSTESADLVQKMTAGERDRATLEADINRADGSQLRAESGLVALPHDSSTGATRVGVVRDVSQRVERERALAESERRYRMLVEHFPEGAVALFNEDLRLTAVGGELLGQVDTTPDDLIGESIYELYPDRIIEQIEGPFRAALDGERNSFEVHIMGRDIVGKVLPVANDDGVYSGMVVLRDVTERNERERALERQRTELEALNDITEVVSEVTTAVVEQSTRQEIEQVVCDALAAADAYEFAWVAGVDRNAKVFEPRATAGTRGYAEEIVVSIDPDDPRSKGPGATAIRERETQVVQDVFEDPCFEPWRAAAEEHGFTAVASIPILNEGTVYGVIGIYADREGAFGPDERRVIDRLGRVVGYAIAAADRKQALMSDELVELEFRTHDVFAGQDEAVGTAGRIVLDTAVPVGDGEFVAYGTAAADAIDTVRGLTDVLEHCQEVSVRGSGDRISFEARLTEPPVLSVVSEIGGYVHELVIDGGDASATIHLAPTVDVRRVIDTVREAYPSAELVRRHQIVRPRGDPHRVQRRIVGSLTDKQRVALDAAYHAGYFEWPRGAAGVEIAESLGLAPSTFSQHLRIAQRKVFDTVYAPE